MDITNNLKVKELQLPLRHNFGLERLKGIPKKVENREDVTDFFERNGRVLYRGWVSVVTNDTVKRNRSLFR